MLVFPLGLHSHRKRNASEPIPRERALLLFYPERDRSGLHRFSAPGQPYPGERPVLPSGKGPEESLLSLAGTARNAAVHEPFRPDRPKRLRQHEGKHLELVRNSRVHGELQPRGGPGEAKRAGGTFRRIRSGSFPLPGAAMDGTGIGRERFRSSNHSTRLGHSRAGLFPVMRQMVIAWSRRLKGRGSESRSRFSSEAGVIRRSSKGWPSFLD